ncbi:MAG TPA: pitrilysin family protein [Roseomonas sp.]
MSRRAALAAGAGLCVAPPVRRAAAFTPPAGERPLFGARLWSLPNGLRVAFAQSRRIPVISQFLFYGAGGGEDPEGLSGIAHYLEHMMFKGSRHVPSGALSQRVAREGGNDNAFTSRDVTAYFQQVEASRLPMIMDMEADRCAEPLFPPPEMASELAVVLEERRLRTDANPRALFREAFGAALWGRQHWHGRPVIGWPEEIRAIRHPDLVGFFQRWYAPSNAVLVIAGDAEADALERLVEQYFGAVPARPAATRHRAPPPAAPVERRLISHSTAIREGSFLRGWIAPSLTYGASEHAWALEVLAHMLGGGQGSLLHEALVETGIAVSASAGYDSDAVGASEFLVSAMPNRGVAPDRVEDAAAAVVERLLQQGANAALVARSIRQITAGALLALDGVGAAPRMLGNALASGLPVEVVEYWPAHIRAVTPEQVTAAARAVLGAPMDAIGWLLPETA